MNTKLYSIYPQRYVLNLYISGHELDNEEFTYYKSVNTDISKKGYHQLDLFSMIQTQFFQEEQVTFVDAKLIVKPINGYFCDVLVKQLAYDFGKSISNFENYVIEKAFLNDSKIITKSQNIVDQIAAIKYGLSVDSSGNNLSPTKVKTNAKSKDNADSNESSKQRKSHKSSKEKSSKQKKPKKKDIVVEEETVEIDDDELDNLVSTNGNVLNQKPRDFSPETIEKTKHHQRPDNVKLESRRENGNKHPTNLSKEQTKSVDDWRDLCYQDGIWHKWILERLNDEEKKMYHRIKERLEEQDIYCDENKIIRFLAAREFDEEAAMEMLIDNSKFYKENDVEEIHEEEFKKKIESEPIVVHKTDKFGRPLVYFRLRFNHPSDANDRQLMQYMLWIMEKVKAVTPKHIDNYILIYDLKDAGYSNFSMSQMKGASAKVGSQFPETIFKIFILNSNW